MTGAAAAVESSPATAGIAAGGPGVFVPVTGAMELPEPGDFPVGVLSPAQRAIVESTAEVYRIDPALPGMASLAALGASPGKNLWVTGAVAGRETPSNLFVIAAAPKSYGKNGASTVVAPLLAISDRRAMEFRDGARPRLCRERAVAERRSRLITEWLARGRGESNRAIEAREREDLEGQLGELQARMAEIDPLLESEPTLWVGSYTGAALARALARNGEALLCFCPEAGDAIRIALGRFSKDAKADFDLFLSGYSVEPWSEGRITRGSVNIRPCIGTIWLCQPALLRELLSNEEAMARGMTARFLMFAVDHGTIPHDDGLPRFVPGEAATRWARVLETGVQIRDMDGPCRLACEPEAREAFRAWHNESVDLRNGDFRDVEGELGRWRENAIRIAACLALADAADHGQWPKAISGDCASRALGLCRWAALTALRLMQAGRVERLAAGADRLAEALGGHEGVTTLRTLDHRHGITAGEVRTLAGAFPERFRLTRQKGGGPGRPSEICTLL
ncbi:MAG TPA: DUF3987 domain-containing protein [Verrucomicrobiae bacterium]|nr:DUF3987 domain-containing protein [Verrucomicrobiae bacterium]